MFMCPYALKPLASLNTNKLCLMESTWSHKIKTRVIQIQIKARQIGPSKLDKFEPSKLDRPAKIRSLNFICSFDSTDVD